MRVVRFEPRFYERAAQRHLVGLSGSRVFANVRWGLRGTPESRVEIDAVWRHEGELVAAEIKAHIVDTRTVEELLTRYRARGFRRVLLVAPAFSPAAQRQLAAAQRPAAEAVVFTPELDEITEFYGSRWSDGVPSWVHQTLGTGLHHVRFMLAIPTDSGHFTIGQQRARLYDIDSIARSIARLPYPPVRVLWSPQQFTIPRDAIARGSNLTPVGGYVPVDIDGDRLHLADHACELSREEIACTHCVRHANRELARLDEALPNLTWADVLFSGGRGVHAYLPDEQGIRRAVVETATKHRIRIDIDVTASVKAMIALPGSLHAGTGLPIRPLTMTTREVTAC